MSTETATAVTTAISTSLTTLVTNCTTVMTTVLPIGLGIFAMYVVVAFSKKIFKQIISK